MESPSFLEIVVMSLPSWVFCLLMCGALSCIIYALRWYRKLLRRREKQVSGWAKAVFICLMALTWLTASAVYRGVWRGYIIRTCRPIAYKAIMEKQVESTSPYGYEVRSKGDFGVVALFDMFCKPFYLSGVRQPGASETQTIVFVQEEKFSVGHYYPLGSIEAAPWSRPPWTPRQPMGLATKYRIIAIDVTSIRPELITQTVIQGMPPLVTAIEGHADSKDQRKHEQVPPTVDGNDEAGRAFRKWLKKYGAKNVTSE